jgi:hypothetical protein
VNVFTRRFRGNADLYDQLQIAEILARFGGLGELTAGQFASR